MRVRFGGFTHPAAECAVTIAKRRNYGPGGQARSQTEQWTINGILQADTQAAVDAAQAAVMAAYSVDDQDCVLLLNDGTASANRLDTGRALGGVRVVEPPSFPEGGERSAEFSTYRTFRVVVEAEYLNFDLNVLAWVETLSFTGGGPRDLHLQPLRGLPQKQRVAESTPFQVVQRGEAIGLTRYPTPPLPLWPADEKIDLRQVETQHPKRYGPVGKPTYVEWPVRWQYTFESAIPMFGDPSPWPE